MGTSLSEANIFEEKVDGTYLNPEVFGWTPLLLFSLPIENLLQWIKWFPSEFKIKAHILFLLFLERVGELQDSWKYLEFWEKISTGKTETSLATSISLHESWVLAAAPASPACFRDEQEQLVCNLRIISIHGCIKSSCILSVLRILKGAGC